jgi:hypothetical protein
MLWLWDMAVTRRKGNTMKESTLDRMTPGPWHYSSGSVWAGSSKDYSKLEEVSIVKADRSEEKTSPTERDANARACSYVPEMIQALRAIVKRYAYLAETGNPPISRLSENGEIAKAYEILSELERKD